MRVTIQLLYHSICIDRRPVNIYDRGWAHNNVAIDIGTLMDRPNPAAVQRLIDESTAAPDLDPQSAVTYHSFGANPQPFTNGDLDMPIEDSDQLRRRRRNRRLLNRIGDPENGFPILRELIQTFAPMLIQYLMKNLPIWLADLEDEEENPTPVV